MWDILSKFIYIKAESNYKNPVRKIMSKMVTDLSVWKHHGTTCHVI